MLLAAPDHVVDEPKPWLRPTGASLPKIFGLEGEWPPPLRISIRPRRWPCRSGLRSSSPPERTIRTCSERSSITRARRRNAEVGAARSTAERNGAGSWEVSLNALRLLRLHRVTHLSESAARGQAGGERFRGHAAAFDELRRRLAPGGRARVRGATIPNTQLQSH